VVVSGKSAPGLHQLVGIWKSPKKIPDDGLVSIIGDSRLAITEIIFKGKLEKETVAAILSNQMILNGGLEGYFHLSFPVDQQQGVLFNGHVKAHDLQWVWGDFLRQFSITKLSLQGAEEKLILHDLELLFENETVRSQGKTAAAHYAHLVIHGVLHLRGFAHARRADAARMEALERRILRRLGFADPYVLPADGPREAR